MKSYSNVRVLNKFDYNKKRTFFEKIINANQLIELSINKTDYIRGMIFCEDMKEIYGRELSVFEVKNLIIVLYRDFLDQVRDGLEHKDIANYLAKNKEKYFPKKKVETATLSQVRPNSFNFKTNIQYVEVAENNNLVPVRLLMKEKEVLRGEIILSDIEDLIGDYQINLEEVITILYLEFLALLKKEGLSKVLQQSIYSMI